MEIINKIIYRTTPVTGLFLSNYLKCRCGTATTPYFSRDGDSGYFLTSSGDKIPKDSKIADAVGATDELSSYIGLAREFAKDGKHTYTDKLKRVQCILVDISTAILKAEDNSSISCHHTLDLEEWINEYSEQLPPLEHYLIPGGGKACASLHVARSVCRRAERCVIPLVKCGGVDKEAQIYLNR